MNITIQDFLSKPINPEDDIFWEHFNNTLQYTNSKPLDRRGIINSKLLFSNINSNTFRINCIIKFIEIIGSTLKSELAFEISELFNFMVFGNNNIKLNEKIKYINCIKSLSNSNSILKIAFFEDTIQSFLKFLLKPFNLDKKILLELFLFENSLLSHSKIDLQFLNQFFQSDHLYSCYKLMKEQNESIIQINIVEFIWRINRILKFSKQILENIFENNLNFFLLINKSNFKSSIHQFIREINNKNSKNIKEKILHIPFKSILINKFKYNISGFIDINIDNLLILIEKKSIKESFPDIMIYQMSLFESNYFNSNNLIFLSKENNNSFGINNSILYEFECNQSPINFSIEYQRRCKLNQNNKIIKNSKESLIKSPKKDKNRTFAMNNNFENYSTLKNKLNNIENIEEKITKFHENTIKILNDIESRATTEIDDINNRLKDQSRILQQLFEQHQELTLLTTKENNETSINIKQISDEFENRHGEMKSKRNNLLNNLLQEIKSEENIYINNSKNLFEKNAIVGIINTFNQMQEICENNFR